MRWLRRFIGWGCFRHRWLSPVWTGSRWLYVCEKGCIKWEDAA